MMRKWEDIKQQKERETIGEFKRTALVAATALDWLNTCITRARHVYNMLFPRVFVQKTIFQQFSLVLVFCVLLDRLRASVIEN